VGGYDDWLRQRPDTSAPRPQKDKAARTKTASRKLSFKEQRTKQDLEAELAALPSRIEILERKLETAHAKLADPKLYKGPAAAIASAKDALTALETELASAFKRWEKIEAKLLDFAGRD